MKKTLLIVLSVTIISVVFFSSCKKEDPVIPNEEELITTLTYTLTPVGGGNVIELKFHDLDGDGGNAPEITTESLATNTTYSGTLTLLNELQTPPHSVSDEVLEEAEAHQFFFTIGGGVNMAITYNDEDINGNPLGLETNVITTSASLGTLTIVLRHQPKKPNNGSLADAGGESDIQVQFDITIE